MMRELADGQAGSADGNRVDHGIDAAAIVQTRVHQRLRAIDPATDAAHNA